uniref:Uncharacterized protein n=1 Tax=Arundo donax TaxID=35708 RepID=A0A0A8XVE2_ARUDO
MFVRAISSWLSAALPQNAFSPRNAATHTVQSAPFLFSNTLEYNISSAAP